MTRRISPFSLAGIVAAGLIIGTPALAAMSELDSNGDGQIDQSELQQGGAQAMQRLDSNGDGVIDQTEFEAATGGGLAFSTFDTNGDGQIDEQEFQQAVFAEYDQNADQMLDEQEYAQFEQAFGGASAAGSTSGSTSSEDAATDMGSTESDLTAESEASTTDTMSDDTMATDTMTDDTLSDDTMATASTMGGGLSGYTADEVMGASVIGAEGEEIAEVSDLVIDSSDQVSDVVIDAGGFLGIGSTTVALPASDLQVSQDDSGNLVLTTSYTQEQLEQLGEYEDVDGDDYRLWSTDPAGTVDGTTEVVE